jgi:transposase
VNWGKAAQLRWRLVATLACMDDASASGAPGAPGCPRCVEFEKRLAEQAAAFEKRIAQLMARIEVLERTAKRQAAPFSKGPPKKRPRKPGRKSGDQHGTHGHRPPPDPASIDEVLDAPLPHACPRCGGDVEETHTDTIHQEEIRREPIRRKFTVHCGKCRSCGKTCRGRHRLQTSDATGAAASQIGPDAQAAVVYLNKKSGLSHGKIADLFDQCFGIKITRGAAAQIVTRSARRLEPAHQEITEQLKAASHITPDETGWHIGGQAVWLHAWVGDNGATLYRVDPQRSAEVLQTVIGLHWSGSMTHDGFSSYDRFEDAAHQQCVDHAVRRARDLLESQTGGNRRFPQAVLDLFGDALDLRDRFAADTLAGKAPTEEVRAAAYEKFILRLCERTRRPRADEANERFAKHLSKHAAEWFLFLIDPTIPATNHRAEQALKTPITSRKNWGGNRTTVGAHVQGVTCSVIETCRRTTINAFDYLSDAFRGFVDGLFACPVGLER